MQTTQSNHGASLKRLVIVGSGGFGRELRWLIDEINQKLPTFSIIGFARTDKTLEPEPTVVDGLPVYGAEFFSDNSPYAKDGIAVAIGIGMPSIRRRVAMSLPHWTTFPNLIHPSVRTSNRILLGTSGPENSGIIITAGNILTTNIQIANHCLINLACTVGHDVSIGAYAVVSPGVNISGCVTIGSGSSLGTGAKVIEGKRIGEWSVVGAGSVVISDVPDNSTAVGTPAKVVKTRPAGWQELATTQNLTQNPT